MSSYDKFIIFILYVFFPVFAFLAIKLVFFWLIII